MVARSLLKFLKTFSVRKGVSLSHGTVLSFTERSAFANKKHAQECQKIFALFAFK